MTKYEGEFRNVLTDRIVRVCMATKTSKNFYDYFEDEINQFLTLDDSAINSVIKFLNENHGSISLQQMEKLTGFSTLNGDANHIRGLLANLVHYHLNHVEQFNEHATTSQVDKDKLSKIITLVKQLNAKSLEGLQIRYSIMNASNSSYVKEVNGDVVLKEIHDKENQNKFVAYVPVIKIVIEVKDEGDKSNFQKIEMEYDELVDLIDTFDDLRKKFLESSKRFKTNIKDTCILTET